MTGRDFLKQVPNGHGTIVTGIPYRYWPMIVGWAAWGAITAPFRFLFGR